MKNIVVVLILMLAFACKSSKVIMNNDDPSQNEIPKPSKNDIIMESTKSKTPVNPKDVEASMRYLASDELEGRNTGTPGIEKAAVYIEDIFKESGLKPYFKTYRDSFKIKDIIGYNIIGYVEGNDPKLKKEFVILGAHYDHIGNGKEVNGDNIANGANDDASGTVAVLEWAKYFAKKKNNKRSVIFALYSAEEMGLLGSADLAKRLKDSKLNLYTMINFEMIGVPRNGNVSMAYMSGYEKSNMAQKLNDYAGKDIIGFLKTAKDYQLFKRSDNYSFYKVFKMPAHAISTFDFTNFDYYHHVDDEADKMDFNHMTKFMNDMIPALEGMMNSSTKEIEMNEE